MECADAAHGLGGHIISDGGCTCPGDFAKAFGGGADFIMSGGMFAGHDESGGELVEASPGKWVKTFYGMSSAVAMKKHAGGVANYRSSEGKAITVGYRGPVHVTLRDILGKSKEPPVSIVSSQPPCIVPLSNTGLPTPDLYPHATGGLRSACTYVGAATLEELPRRTTFIRVSMQLNTVFGTEDKSKGNLVPSASLLAAQAAVSDGASSDSKRQRKE